MFNFCAEYSDAGVDDEPAPNVGKAEVMERGECRKVLPETKEVTLPIGAFDVLFKAQSKPPKVDHVSPHSTLIDRIEPGDLIQEALIGESTYDGAALTGAELTKALADHSDSLDRTLLIALTNQFSVFVPPGRIGVAFAPKGVVYEINEDSGMYGLIEEGDVLVSVNGTASPEDVTELGKLILASDDGKAEREFLFAPFVRTEPERRTDGRSHRLRLRRRTHKIKKVSIRRRRSSAERKARRDSKTEDDPDEFDCCCFTAIIFVAAIAGDIVD